MFKERRERFMQAMKTGVAIFPSAPIRHKTADMDYEYRPDSDLYYLTGFEEPESVTVLIPDHPEHRFVLFVRPRDLDMEIWNGRRAGPEGARIDYGADAAYTIDQLDEILPKYLDTQETLYYSLGKNSDFDARVVEWMASYRTKARRGVSGPSTIVDPTLVLHDMRLFKGAEEIALIRRTAEISAEGHVAAMKACKPGMYEYELQAELEYVFRRRGARGPAYSSIVGAGANACILHYVENRDLIRDGDLVLIDAGAEYQWYAGDITRTFPANGRFTEPQRELYELVLEAQLEAIKMARPGVRFNEVHERTLEILTTGMVRLGLLHGDVKELIEKEAYRRFYMHKTGHWLGIDVHDVGRYKVDGQWRELEPGMVMTIEPGIYVAADAEGVDPKYRGIGIRIEDDVLITETGHEVLTKDVPKTVEEIEALMQGKTLAAR